jgi:hypothetical protein
MKLAFNRNIALAAGLASLPLLTAAPALAGDEPAKVYYNDGMRLETKEVDVKFNMLLQPYYEYTAYDRNEAASGDPGANTNSFDLRHSQFFMSGHLMNKQFSFRLMNDFSSETNGSSLADAWLQWNCDCDLFNVRAGQFFTPYSRQGGTFDQYLQFATKSVVTDAFALDRQNGAMVHGEIGDGIHYYLNVFNGESAGEGQNLGGVDTDLALSAAITAQTMGYGSRGYEGDLRENKDSTDFTGGLSSIYGRGSFGTGDDVAIADFDRFDLNGDLGMRSGGFSLQAEMYYSYLDLNNLSTDYHNWGFYTQGGFMVAENMEIAGRFGYIDFDDDFVGYNGYVVDTLQEYTASFNYYMNGHSMKLQTGVTWINGEFQDDSSDNITDFQFITQLTGYL